MTIATLTIYQQVEALTKLHFGEELGTWLFEHNLIIPVNNDKTPATRSWTKFQSFNYKYLNELPDGLAVVMSDKLRVLDIDNKDNVRGNPNVLTAKGAHYWFTGGDFDKTINNKQDKYDIKITGYAVFWGEGKTYIHSNIYTWNELESLYPLTYIGGFPHHNIDITEEKEVCQILDTSEWVREAKLAVSIKRRPIEAEMLDHAFIDFIASKQKQEFALSYGEISAALKITKTRAEAVIIRCINAGVLEKLDRTGKQQHATNKYRLVMR